MSPSQRATRGAEPPSPPVRGSADDPSPGVHRRRRERRAPRPSAASSRAEPAPSVRLRGSPRRGQPPAPVAFGGHGPAPADTADRGAGPRWRPRASPAPDRRRTTRSSTRARAPRHRLRAGGPGGPAGARSAGWKPPNVRRSKGSTSTNSSGRSPSSQASSVASRAVSWTSSSPPPARNPSIQAAFSAGVDADRERALQPAGRVLGVEHLRVGQQPDEPAGEQPVEIAAPRQPSRVASHSARRSADSSAVAA